MKLLHDSDSNLMEICQLSKFKFLVQVLDAVALVIIPTWK